MIVSSAFILRKWPRWRPWLIAAVALCLGALLIEALATMLRGIHYADILTEISRQSSTNLILCAIATALSYLALTGYDFSALEYAKVRLKKTTVVRPSGHHFDGNYTRLAELILEQAR